MFSRRHWALAARVTLGTALGLVLVVGGMTIARRTTPGPVSSDSLDVALGATSVMAGLVWFMIVVADRLCPLVRRGWVDLAEGLLMAGVLTGLGWSARMYMLGAHA